MKAEKLKDLERRAAALRADAQLVAVCFANGTKRATRIADVIPLLQEGVHPHVVDVQGEARKNDGRLLELVQALVREEA